MYRFLLVFILSLQLNAYELPKLELKTDGRAEIIFFNATNILVDKHLSYILKWETSNATSVTMTYIGKVPSSGNITVTQDEFNRGEVELRASNSTSDFVDIFVLNTQKDDLPPPVKFDKPEVQEQRYYNTRPYRGARRPYRRRYY